MSKNEFCVVTQKVNYCPLQGQRTKFLTKEQRFEDDEHLRWWGIQW